MLPQSDLLCREQRRDEDLTQKRTEENIAKILKSIPRVFLMLLLYATNPIIDAAILLLLRLLLLLIQPMRLWYKEMNPLR